MLAGGDGVYWICGVGVLPYRKRGLLPPAARADHRKPTPHVPASRGALCFMIQLFLRKKVVPVLEQQIGEYMTWRERMYPLAAVGEKRWLHDFFRVTGKREVCEVTIVDVGLYHKHVTNEYQTRHSEQCAMKAIGCFFAYFHARGWPCISRESVHGAIAYGRH